GEAPDHGLGQRCLQIIGDGLGQGRVRVPGDQLERTVLHALNLPFPCHRWPLSYKEAVKLAISHNPCPAYFFSFLELTGNEPLPGQGDGVDVAAVVRLAPVGGAPEAVEPLGIGISADGHVFDLGDTGYGEPGGDEAGQIELRMSRPAVREEA